jgi:hypothetical protein
MQETSSLQQLKERLGALLAELEEQCAQAEAALRARHWDALEVSFADQRRTRQAIVNELAAAACDAQTLPDVYLRLQAILTFRDDQLRRLQAYRTEISRRLQVTRKWKDAAKSARRGMGPSPVVISRVL